VSRLVGKQAWVVPVVALHHDSGAILVCGVAILEIRNSDPVSIWISHMFWDVLPNEDEPRAKVLTQSTGAYEQATDSTTKSKCQLSPMQMQLAQNQN